MATTKTLAGASFGGIAPALRGGAMSVLLATIACGGPDSGGGSGEVGSRAVAELAAIPGAIRSESVGIGFRGMDDGTGMVPPFEPIAGEARFNVTRSGVDLTVTVRGCKPFVKGYPLRIHARGSCAEVAAAEGSVWERGDGIPDLYCPNTGGTGNHHYTRVAGQPDSWSVGGAAASDLRGRVLVIHDPGTHAPLACGPITQREPTPQELAGQAGAAPTTERPAIVRAQLAGHCLFKLRAGADPQTDCPDPEALAECASEHCDLAACEQPCAAYLDCLQGEPDPCASLQCAMDAECGACTAGTVPCAFGFCQGEIACAPPAPPGGACDELRACCQLQQDWTDRCLMLVDQLEAIGGEPTCIGTKMDWDWNAHLPVECTYD